ncbi:MAG: hypothetical protein ACRD5L_05120, partial [Bryobacteraceae bacterium]
MKLSRQFPQRRSRAARAMAREDRCAPRWALRRVIRRAPAALAICAAIYLAACSGTGGSVTPVAPAPVPAATGLTALEVQALVQSAAEAASPDTMVIAVVDR